MRIAISGAGPTLASLLLKGGHPPILVEKAPAFRPGGPAILARGYKIGEVRFVCGDGSRASGFSADIFHRMTGGRDVSLPRGDLAEAIHCPIALPDCGR